MSSNLCYLLLHWSEIYKFPISMTEQLNKQKTFLVILNASCGTSTPPLPTRCPKRSRTERAVLCGNWQKIVFYFLSL